MNSTQSTAADIKIGRYHHYKGNDYEVLAVAKYSEDPAQLMVVYRALYGNHDIWVRPATMWNELVTVNGEQVPRFRYIPDAPEQ